MGTQQWPAHSRHFTNILWMKEWRKECLWDEKHSFVPEGGSSQCSRLRFWECTSRVKLKGRKVGHKLQQTLGCKSVEHGWWEGRSILLGLRELECQWRRCLGETSLTPGNGHLLQKQSCRWWRQSLTSNPSSLSDPAIWSDNLSIIRSKVLSKRDLGGELSTPSSS